jgi:hypothetical protein
MNTSYIRVSYFILALCTVIVHHRRENASKWVALLTPKNLFFKYCSVLFLKRLVNYIWSTASKYLFFQNETNETINLPL